MQYRVEWEIEVDAETPREAAAAAFRLMQLPTSAQTFDVYDENGESCRIDLLDQPYEPPERDEDNTVNLGLEPRA